MRMFFSFDKKDKEADKYLTLEKLIENWESEVVEFKEANNDFDKDKIGKYFSAISNEANQKDYSMAGLFLASVIKIKLWSEAIIETLKVLKR